MESCLGSPPGSYPCKDGDEEEEDEDDDEEEEEEEDGLRKVAHGQFPQT